jgi:hypothetical protein
MTTGTEATMVRCRNGENSMILRDRRDSLLMGPNLEFDRRDTLVKGCCSAAGRKTLYSILFSNYDSF